MSGITTKQITDLTKIFGAEFISTLVFLTIVFTREQVYEKGLALVVLVLFGSFFGAGYLNPLPILARQMSKTGQLTNVVVVALLFAQVLASISVSLFVEIK